MAAGTGLGFKLAAAALVAFGLSGKKSSTGTGGASRVTFNPQGEVGVAKLSIANLQPPQIAQSTSDQFNSALVKITSNPVTDISIGSTLLLAAIGSPVIAVIVLGIVEVVFEIFSAVALWQQEQDMLKKGAAGAQTDLQKIANGVVGALVPVFTKVGFSAADAADLATLCGFSVARSYNDSALNYFINGYYYGDYAAKKQASGVAIGGRTISLPNEYMGAGQAGNWGTDPACGYPYERDVLGNHKSNISPLTVDQYWMQRGCCMTIMDDQSFLGILGFAGDINALKAKGASMIGDWASIYQMMDFIGRAAFCSMALVARWDCAGPMHFGGWIAPTEGAEQGLSEWYLFTEAIMGGYDIPSKRLKDANGSGLTWDVGQTFATSKMVIITP